MPTLRTTARALIRLGPVILVAAGVGEAFTHLPGGGVEAGETPTQALRRELHEELGVQATVLTPLTILANAFIMPTGEEIAETLHLFAAAVPALSWDLFPRSPEAQTVLRWVSVDDIVYRRVGVQPASILPWIVRA